MVQQFLSNTLECTKKGAIRRNILQNVNEAHKVLWKYGCNFVSATGKLEPLHIFLTADAFSNLENFVCPLLAGFLPPISVFYFAIALTFFCLFVCTFKQVSSFSLWKKKLLSLIGGRF